MTYDNSVKCLIFQLFEAFFVYINIYYYRLQSFVNCRYELLYENVVVAFEFKYTNLIY